MLSDYLKYFLSFLAGSGIGGPIIAFILKKLDERKKIRIKPLYEEDFGFLYSILGSCFPNYYFPLYQILVNGKFNGPIYFYVASIRITSIKQIKIRISRVKGYFFKRRLWDKRKMIESSNRGFFFSSFIKRKNNGNFEYNKVIEVFKPSIKYFVDPDIVNKEIEIEDDLYIPFILNIKKPKDNYYAVLLVDTSLRKKPYKIRLKISKAPGWWWQGTEL